MFIVAHLTGVCRGQPGRGACSKLARVASRELAVGSHLAEFMLEMESSSTRGALASMGFPEHGLSLVVLGALLWAHKERERARRRRKRTAAKRKVAESSSLAERIDATLASANAGETEDALMLAWEIYVELLRAATGAGPLPGELDAEQEALLEDARQQATQTLSSSGLNGARVIARAQAAAEADLVDAFAAGEREASRVPTPSTADKGPLVVHAAVLQAVSLAGVPPRSRADRRNERLSLVALMIAILTLVTNVAAWRLPVTPPSQPSPTVEIIDVPTSGRSGGQMHDPRDLAKQPGSSRQAEPPMRVRGEPAEPPHP